MTTFSPVAACARAQPVPPAVVASMEATCADHAGTAARRWPKGDAPRRPLETVPRQGCWPCLEPTSTSVPEVSQAANVETLPLAERTNPRQQQRDEHVVALMTKSVSSILFHRSPLSESAGAPAPAQPSRKPEVASALVK
jgi:hypothetical protein